MTHLSIGKAWTEAVALVQREGALLFPVAFALLGLPSAVFSFAQPDAVAGQPVPPGPWMLLIIPLLILTLIGSLTLVLLLDRHGVTVGEAVRAAIKRFLPVFGMVLLVSVALTILVMPMVTLSAMAMTSPASAGAALLVSAITLVAFAAIGPRLLLTNVVGALEPVGPIAILRRSWALSRGHFWRLLGFVIVAGLLFVVASLAIGSIAGILVTLLIGAPTVSALAKLLLALVGGAISAVFAVYFTAILVRIYTQLGGGNQAGVSLSKGI